MKKCRRIIYGAPLLLALLFAGCSSDDDANTPPPEEGNDPPTEVNSKVYDLGAVLESGISGTARFAELSDGSVTIDLDLENTPSGGMHPAHIHANTAAEGGEVVLTLGTVDGSSGESTVTVTQWDDGSTVTYEELLDYNGYINVHLSADNLETIVAQGDIGQNELTGEAVTYPLNEAAVEGISGTVEFAQRVNGTTLATIQLNGTPAGGEHPAHVHENDAATGGDVIIGLTSVDGNTGMSKTQIAELAGGGAITYAELLELDAHVNVHLSAEELGTIVAQGDIGANVGASTASAIANSFDVTNEGSTAYIFNNEELENESNPILTLQRGQTYTFNINTPGHPFYIKTVQGIGTENAYEEGVTNNGAVSGEITFTVPDDAPVILYYNCEFHAGMTGEITIVD